MAAVKWGGRIFKTPAELAEWLRARGGPSIQEWAIRNPVAAKGFNMGAGAYQDQIQNEGIYTAQAGQLQAEDFASAAQRRAQIRNLIAQYGGAPAGFTDKFGDIDAATLALAGKNPYSTIATLDRNQKQDTGSMVAQLAARGVVQSGENALKRQEIGYQRGRDEYDAINELMGSIGGLEGEYASGVRGRAGQQADYASQAMDRLVESGFRPTPTGPLVPRKRPKKIRTLPIGSRRPTRDPYRSGGQLIGGWPNG